MRPSARHSCPAFHQKPAFAHPITLCTHRSFVGSTEKFLLFPSLTSNSPFVPIKLRPAHHLLLTLKLILRYQSRQFVFLVAFSLAYLDENDVVCQRKSRGLAVKSYLILALN